MGSARCRDDILRQEATRVIRMGFRAGLEPAFAAEALDEFSIRAENFGQREHMYLVLGVFDGRHLKEKQLSNPAGIEFLKVIGAFCHAREHRAEFTSMKAC